MAHTFHFFRAGGFDQVRLQSGADLAHLDELDFKLWVALACPIKGLALDPKTLALLDSEKDGRVRANEVLAAVKWAISHLTSPDELLRAPTSLPLASLATATDENKQLVIAAKTILKDLGRPDATSVTVEDAEKATLEVTKQPFNGDGVIPPESASEPEHKQLIADVMATVGSTDDASGKKGVTQTQVKHFFEAVDQYVGWLSKSEAEAGVMPLKDATVAAYDARQAVASKVDDYFTRTRLAAFDPRALTALNREEKEYLPWSGKELNVSTAELRGFPLARIEAGRALPLKTGLNPGWAEAMGAFEQKTVAPLLGAQTELTEAQWHELAARFATYEGWLKTKPMTPVEALGAKRLRELHAGPARTWLDGLFAKEKEQQTIAAGFASVEKLARFTRDLYRLLNNFVSFRDFYEGKQATFQVGTLWLDQRECHLCLKVEDLAKHVTMAPLSRGYVAYCDVTKPATNEKMTICAVITNGGSDNLMVGRNGLFRDRDGRDWDATITKIVDNPISIREAFWSPYKKAIRFVEEQVAKRAAEADTKGTAALTSQATALGTAATTAPPKPAATPAGPTPVPPPKKLDIGVVAALGVAVGGITAALGALLQGFFGLGVWMPVGVLGVLLLISGPSMLIAWLKLRERNIGPLLDASGWAVNAHAMLNVPFGKSLTKKGKLPPGSHLDLRDPYADKNYGWVVVVLALVGSLGVAWSFGALDGLLPERVRSVAVLGEKAPAYEPPADAPDAGAL